MLLSQHPSLSKIRRYSHLSKKEKRNPVVWRRLGVKFVGEAEFGSITCRKSQTRWRPFVLN